MKTPHRLFTLLAGIAFRAHALESEKNLPEFQVVKTEKDLSLKQDESVFTFNFMNDEFRAPDGGFPLVHLSFNGTPQVIRLDKTMTYVLKLRPGTYKFQFYATYFYDEIYSDSVKIRPGHKTTVELRFQPAVHQVKEEKPVIYLYPEIEQTVDIRVIPNGRFKFTYPPYADGWKGIAHTDGSITIAGKTYPYLFWEAEVNVAGAAIDLRKGYVVPAEELISFFEEKLTAIGLNAKEQTDFITYWGPRLSANTANFIQFVSGGACDVFAKLSITPQPDHVNRLYMLWQPAAEAAQPEPQILPVFDRSGFDVLEWGGSEIRFKQEL